MRAGDGLCPEAVAEAEGTSDKPGETSQERSQTVNVRSEPEKQEVQQVNVQRRRSLADDGWEQQQPPGS